MTKYSRFSQQKPIRMSCQFESMHCIKWILRVSSRSLYWKRPLGPRWRKQEGNGESCIKRSIETCTFTKYDSSHLEKKDEMKGIYGTRQGEGNIYRTIVTGGRWSWRNGTYWTPRYTGKIIVKLILNKQNGRTRSEFIRLRVGVRGELQWSQRIDPSGFITRTEFHD
jgi:hypothetical protein